MALKDVQIIITGKRWFQASYGNTYHAVEVVVYNENNNCIIDTVIPEQYGYGDQYIYTAIAYLKEHGVIPKSIDSVMELRRNYTLTCKVYDVKTQRELKSSNFSKPNYHK